MAQVTWTLEAQVWLRDIYDFIAADNPAAAGRVAYLIKASSGDIDILGVFHGALPIERYLL